MKRILSILALFCATVAIFVVANFAVGNLYVSPVQAQDAIEDVTERQDSPSQSDVLRTLPSGAVEKPTDTTQPIGEPPTSQAQNDDLACNNNDFTSSIGGGFLSNNPFIRTDKRPNNYSAFKEDCLNPGVGECWGKPRYRYYARWNNIKEWRGKICAKSVENNFNNHLVSYQSSSDSSCPIGGQNYCQIYEGLRVRFEVKGHNEPENQWQPIQKDGKLASYEIPANQTKNYTWAWKTSEPSDFRLAVRYAKPDDEFDFMMDK